MTDDNELGDSQKESQKDGLEVPVVPRRNRGDVPVDETSARRGLLMLMGLVGVGAAVISLALFGMKDKAIYSKPVDELLAEKAKFKGRSVRAEGTLVHGSLQKRESPCEYRFTIASKGVEVPVRFAQCVVPDTFKDVPTMDVAVTVEGELKSDNSFEATSVLAKCPSKYEMEQMKSKGATMPYAREAIEKR
jgi:cytochrome c-type biogenesis protein CcmE